MFQRETTHSDGRAALASPGRQCQQDSQSDFNVPWQSAANWHIANAIKLTRRSGLLRGTLSALLRATAFMFSTGDESKDTADVFCGVEAKFNVCTVFFAEPAVKKTADKVIMASCGHLRDAAQA